MHRLTPFLVAMLLCIFASRACAGESKDVKWDEVNIIGSLGKPLGTWIRIEGKAPEKPLMMSSPLVVSRVNGVKLTTPVTIEVHCDGKLEKGKTYNFRGYESAGMVSTPTDPENHSAGQPQQDYHFAVWFEGGSVVKD